MIILGIETSCDETALCVLEVKKKNMGVHSAGTEEPHFKVLGNVLISQTKIHEQYGGVFPMMAKREHAKNLTPLLHKVLGQAGLLFSHSKEETENSQDQISPEIQEKIKALLIKEEHLYEHFIKLVQQIKKPAIDAIAVTSGPGLEPALWVGISFAKALGTAWDIPVVAVNHMEGHIVGSLLQLEKNEKSSSETELPLKKIEFPALALLISGGHTELVLVKEWRKYQLIGKTRDDAVGEAFDKVARLLGLPYPGGPEISRLAEQERKSIEGSDKKIDIHNAPGAIVFPRPMIHSGDFDFSFSGLKTAVLYLVKGQNKNEKSAEKKNMSTEMRGAIAKEFEDAVTETLTAKTSAALQEFGVRTLIIGGGVIANTHIRQAFEEVAKKHSLTLYLPDPSVATDNALMIAIAGYFVHASGDRTDLETLRASGNLSF